MIALLLLACAMPVRVDSRPTGALLEHRGDSIYLPAEVSAGVRLGRPDTRVSAPDHRTIERPRLVRPFKYPFELIRPSNWVRPPRREVRFVLVPEHDGVGTWTPESEDLE